MIFFIAQVVIGAGEIIYKDYTKIFLLLLSATQCMEFTP